jgi:hypothetical protein
VFGSVLHYCPERCRFLFRFHTTLFFTKRLPPVGRWGRCNSCFINGLGNSVLQDKCFLCKPMVLYQMSCGLFGQSSYARRYPILYGALASGAQELITSVSCHGNWKVIWCQHLLKIYTFLDNKPWVYLTDVFNLLLQSN